MISRRRFTFSATAFLSASFELARFGRASASQHFLKLKLLDFLDREQTDAIAAGRYSDGMVEAFRSALARLNNRGGTLCLPAGRMLLDSAQLGGAGLEIGAHVQLEGDDAAVTQIDIIGDTLCRLFRLKNAFGAKISNLSLTGNNRSIGETVGAAIDCRFTETVNQNALTLERLSLDNFAAPGWIHVIADQSSHIRQVSLSDIKVTSRAGNSVSPGNIGHNSAAIRVDALAGQVSTLTIRNVTADATYIKSGIALYGAISNIVVQDCSIDNAGVQGAEDDSGAYAIQVYSAGRDMRNILIANARIRNPRSCGIYCTLANNVVIRDAVISGQTDLKDDTLPKAAIALNGTRNASVTGGYLTGNAVAIAFITPRLNSHALSLEIENVSVGAASKAAFYARSQDEKSPPIAVRFSNCSFEFTGAGIAIRNNLAATIGSVTIRQCCILAGGRAIDIYQDSPSGKSRLDIVQSSVSGEVSSLRARDADADIRIQNSHLFVADGREIFDVRNIAGLQLENVLLSGPRSQQVLQNLSQEKGIGQTRFNDVRVSHVPEAGRQSCDGMLL